MWVDFVFVSAKFLVGGQQVDSNAVSCWVRLNVQFCKAILGEVLIIDGSGEVTSYEMLRNRNPVWLLAGWTSFFVKWEEKSGWGR